MHIEAFAACGSPVTAARPWPTTVTKSVARGGQQPAVPTKWVAAAPPTFCTSLVAAALREDQKIVQLCTEITKDLYHRILVPMVLIYESGMQHLHGRVVQKRAAARHRIIQSFPQDFGSGFPLFRCSLFSLLPVSPTLTLH